MIPNSKYCKMAKCKNYPCTMKYGECKRELAFDQHGNFFIASKRVATYLNHKMKQRIANGLLGLPNPNSNW